MKEIQYGKIQFSDAIYVGELYKGKIPIGRGKMTYNTGLTISAEHWNADSEEGIYSEHVINLYEKGIAYKDPDLVADCDYCFGADVFTNYPIYQDQFFDDITITLPNETIIENVHCYSDGRAGSYVGFSGRVNGKRVCGKTDGSKNLSFGEEFAPFGYYGNASEQEKKEYEKLLEGVSLAKYYYLGEKNNLENLSISELEENKLGLFILLSVNLIRKGAPIWQYSSENYYSPKKAELALDRFLEYFEYSEPFHKGWVIQKDKKVYEGYYFFPSQHDGQTPYCHQYLLNGNICSVNREGEKIVVETYKDYTPNWAYENLDYFGELHFDEEDEIEEEEEKEEEEEDVGFFEEKEIYDEKLDLTIQYSHWFDDEIKINKQLNNDALVTYEERIALSLNLENSDYTEQLDELIEKLMYSENLQLDLLEIETKIENKRKSQI